MKKILLVSLMLITVAVSAQDFRIGVKGTFYSTWLFNTNIADQGEFVDYAATFSPSFGATSAIFFTENLAVTLDVLYAANNQKLEPADDDIPYEAITRVKYLDLPLLLKISSSGGAYVEIGPQFSLLMAANEDFVVDIPGVDGYTKKNFKKDFNSFNIAPILGFGVDIPANDNLFINIGLRFGYGLNDVTVKHSEAEMLLDEHSFFSGFAHYNAETPPEYNYKKTFRAFGGITAGVIFKLD